MQEVTRNTYSLYKRDTGSRTIWYARFWDDDLQVYSSGRSTGQTTKAAANRQVQKWLAEGIPEAKKKDSRVTQKRILTAIIKYLEGIGVIDKDRQYETGELIKLFYTQVLNQQMSSGEQFVAYLYRFWDWDGNYVQGRLERGKSIGKRYVDGNRIIIKLHIAPYFKDTLLADVTTKSLEDFMRSFPRREIDPENGYARRTINIIMKVIKGALKDAARLKIIPQNPAADIELLADDTRERGILTPAEVQRLFQLAWVDERGKTASILAAVSGMRLSEIIALRIDDLDTERNIIHVLHAYSPREKSLKGTKTGKPRIIYTDSSILSMLTNLYKKNPHADSFIFYSLEPHKPVRAETIEDHLEKALGSLLGEEIKTGMTIEWKAITQTLLPESGIQPDEIIALYKDNLDTTKNCICIDHGYSFKTKKLEVLKYSQERRIPINGSVLQRLMALCMKEPYVFILGGSEISKQISLENLEPKETKRIIAFLGEIARRERNLSFHGFRHFFNSTIRGTVSDDILRLQTGHSDEKMTDRYDHMTDDRGEQLRKAVQTKILPFIPVAAGE
ncbi:hypothetical protein AGMMS49991_10000 [Spirochaetia bacterium]|nr:hypothetical protein AGMMS49991_10000 [Spirochaetia bacterium]